MNHLYRSLWSKALGAWIAVSEISKGQGKRSSNRRRPLLVASLLLFSNVNYALPTGEQLMAGQASVSTPNANTLQINQASQNAVINWQGFSVAQQEAVNIQQPNAQAALLNRVVGQDASQIQGQINANGQVYLVNPNGVVFGKSAQVDVGGLVASTHNISDADFMSGKNHFTQDGATGSVENHGTINTAEGGVVALIAEQVTNTGTINTPKGTTALAAGKTVDLEFQGNGLVEVKVSEAALNAQITNQGAIQADGGRVILSAKAAGQLIDTVINQQGIIRAQSLVERNGEIILDGGEKGITQNNGTLDTDAQPTASTATGGNIKVTGEHIQINNGATVTASGYTGGGNIQIGDKQSTQQTTLQQHTTVSAKTQNNGKAGTIEILANMHNGTVNVAGKLDASAPTNGDGGYIDTSAAHVNISDSANITTKATNGNTGTWIIDPNDYKIAASGGNITGLTLSNNLKSSNVTISTATQGTAGGNGDIFVNDVVAWSSNLLTLFAERNININAAMNGSGTAQLALDYGQGAVAAGNTNDYFVNAAVNLPAGNNFSTLLGSDGVVKNYTVITQLGAENSLTTTDLQGMNGNLGLNYALGADIDASLTSIWNAGAGFVPVGNIYTRFIGNFDGLGHTITGLTINRPTEDYVGLFGNTSQYENGIYFGGGIISNVGMVKGSVTGQYGVGGLVGDNSGYIINNAYATGSVMGNGGVGGLVGYNSGTINNAYATGSVTGNGDVVGGLVGGNSGIINNAYATGNVTQYNNNIGSPWWSEYVPEIINYSANGGGGLVGSNGGTINNAYATGNVTGNSNLGGLVGNNNIGAVGNNSSGIINNAYATGNVTGNSNIGGLVGVGYVAISNSHYNIDQVLINGGHFVTQGGLYNAQYQDWLSHNKTLNISNYAATLPLASGYYTVSNLQSLRDLLGFADNPAYKFRLNTNIDLATASGFFIPSLAGEFEGAGHILSNFTLNQSFTNNIGLFGFVNTTGTVKNLGLTNIAVTGDNNIGGLVGSNAGNLNNVYTTGNVSGISYDIGGLVGRNSGTINNAYTTGSVSSPNVGINLYSFNGINVGGLVGINYGIITNSNASSSVTGNINVGGLVGKGFYYQQFPTTIKNAYATGKVTGNIYVGGLVGDNSGYINDAYATGSVSGNSSVGGLLGRNGGIINSVYATGNTTGDSNIGGLVGDNAGNAFGRTPFLGGPITVFGATAIIKNAYATGSVTGNSSVGGLVGSNSGRSFIENAYATGSMTGNSSVGGLVGINYDSHDESIKNSFWDTQSTGQPINGVGSGYIAGATGKTTAGMKQLATFTSAGWDINDSDGGSSVWWMYEGFSPPLLRTFLPPIISHGLLYTFLLSKAGNSSFFPINTALRINNNTFISDNNTFSNGNNIGITIESSNLDFWLSQLSVLQTRGTFLDQYTQQLANHNTSVNADLGQYQGELYQLIGYDYPKIITNKK